MEPNLEDVVLSDYELRILSDQVWQELKIDPGAARRFLTEAGWISKRFGIEGDDSRSV